MIRIRLAGLPRGRRGWLVAGPASVAAACALAAVAGAGPVTAASAPVQRSGGTADCDSVTTCYTPEQVRVAYGIQPLTRRGFTGKGETVVIPAVAETQADPPLVSNINQDLAGFDKAFGLPAPSLRVNSAFAPGAVPALSYGEETLDVEMVHAIAPDAAIRVLLLTPAALAKTRTLIEALTETIRYGTAHGDVISISAAVGEHCFTAAELARMHAALGAAAGRQVTVIGGSGDTGPVGAPCTIQFPQPSFPLVREVSMPSSDPLVLATGGTSLAASHKTGAYRGEIAWGLPYGDPGSGFQASGGGFSHRFSRPAYQAGVAGIRATSRGVPDVSADASGHTGMALVISMGGGQFSVRNSGGTSATAPFWAGLITVADQYAGHDLGLVNPSLYRIAAGPLYHRAFHDVTKGINTVKFPPRTYPGYPAAPGWDPDTGLGSPNACVLVPLLARHTGAATNTCR
jgi:subtilase family serine protease